MVSVFLSLFLGTPVQIRFWEARVKGPNRELSSSKLALEAKLNKECWDGLLGDGLQERVGNVDGRQEGSSGGWIAHHTNLNLLL